jgi:plastocyanin
VKPRIVVLLVLVCAALAAAGCGSSNKSNSTGAANTTPPASSTPTPTAPSTTPKKTAGGGGASTVKLSADPGGMLKFDTSSLTAKAGKVTLDMANPSPVSHAIGVKGNGVTQQGQTVGQGSNSTVTVTLKPGKYTFYCPVDGHEAAGMKGTLTVK